MIPDLGPLLKHLPPKTASALRQAINVCSKKLQMPADWVQRWIAFTLIADALTQYTRAGVRMFELKGGAAIELRLRQKGSPGKPRASKDLDATFRGVLDEIQEAVEDALRPPRQGFTFRLEIGDETPKHMRRFWIAVSYNGKSFSRVKLEISAYEGTYLEAELVPAINLEGFGFAGPARLPCIPLAKQIAQKIHAVTEVPEKGVNERYRDLVDLTLLSAMVPASLDVQRACVETFLIRAKHPWPPIVAAPDSWIEPLERMAHDVGLAHTDAQEIVRHVAEYVDRIARVA